MIAAYLDETGIHDGATHCVIAGYCGGGGQWRRFEADWRRCVRDFGLELRHLHALDLMKRRKAFFRWDVGRRDAFLGELTSAIRRYRIYPVSVGLVLADFWAASELERRFFTGATVNGGKLITSGCPNRPYFVNFQRCVKNVVSYAAVGGKCQFFFGLDRPFAKYATALWEIIKKSRQPDPTRERLGTIEFPLATESPPLQAADLLAYLTIEHLVGGRLTEPPNGRRPGGRKISDPLHRDLCPIPAELLRWRADQHRVDAGCRHFSGAWIVEHRECRRDGTGSGSESRAVVAIRDGNLHQRV